MPCAIWCTAREGGALGQHPPQHTGQVQAGGASNPSKNHCLPSTKHGDGEAGGRLTHVQPNPLAEQWGGRANGCFSCSVSPSTSPQPPPTPPLPYRVLKLQLLTISVFKANAMLSGNRRQRLLAGGQHGQHGQPSRQGRLLRGTSFRGGDPKAITFGMQTRSRLEFSSRGNMEIWLRRNDSSPSHPSHAVPAALPPAGCRRVAVCVLVSRRHSWGTAISAAAGR